MGKRQSAFHRAHAREVRLVPLCGSRQKSRSSYAESPVEPCRTQAGAPSSRMISPGEGALGKRASFTVWFTLTSGLGVKTQ